MADNKDYILYTHHSPEITSLKEFVEQLGLSIVRGMTAQEVLDYTDENNVTNNERIYNAYNRYEKQTYINEFNAGTLDFLKVNTILALPKDRLFKETLAITGKNQIAEEKSFEGFFANQLITLLRDQKYKRSFKQQFAFDSYKVEAPNITVWIWIRALGNSNEGELEGSLVDITPFVENVRTTVNKNGGNFSISLAPARGFVREGKWVLDNQSMSNYFNDKVGNSHVSHQSSIQRTNSKYYRTSQFLHNAINTNDLVFIRFETLDLELQERKPKGSFELPNTEIPSSEGALRVYDMIGLVDDNNISYSSESNDISISISGKDLAKVLIDDGSYFYPLQFAQNVFVNPDEDDKLIKRLATDGQFILQSSLAYRSIQYTLQYIINHLASLGLVPDEFFEPYGDKRTQVYRLDNENAESQQKASQIDIERKAIKEIIRQLLIKNGKEASTLNINNVYTQCHDFLTQEYLANNIEEGNAPRSGLVPLGLFSSSSFGGENIQNWHATPRSVLNFDIALFVPEGYVVRDGVFKPIFDEESSRFLNPSADLTSEGQPDDVSNGGVGFYSVFRTQLCERLYKLIKKEQSPNNEVINERFAKGIWQIIKLVVDENVSDRRMADPSISQPDGSLINQFRKICQEPFVEFFTDTYEDLFYFIVRKPPFTGEAIRSFVRGNVTTEEKNIILPNSFNEVSGRAAATGSDFRVVESTQQVLIDIEAGDVISEQLAFDDEEVYSFYELKPQGLFAGKGSEVSLAYIPIVYFPQYANIWGTRRLSIVSNYLPYNGLVGNTADENTNWLVEQSALDLKFLIDTHSYLPFTRKGTIIINGDRRIKRGTFIRYKPTNEIFYVNSVSHFFSISESRVERTTTLNVERGMVEEYIEGKDVDIDGETVNMSYFNIVDSELIRQFIVASLDGDNQAEESLGVQIKRNFAVNDKVFVYFLKRRQLSYE